MPEKYLHARVGIFIGLIVLLSGMIDLEGLPSLWWDEGWTLCVARTWLERGHYGCLLAGEPASSALAGSFSVVAPVALSFRLFGIGIWQGRIVGLLFTAAALVLFSYLVRQLYNRTLAIATLLVLLLLPTREVIHPLLIGRQVLGEMPAIFYLLAGYTCFFLAQQRSSPFLLPAIGFWGIALRTKAQVEPFWLISLLVPLVLVLYKRQWRPAMLITLGVFGSLGASSPLRWGQQLLLAGHTLPFPPMQGLTDTHIVVLASGARLSALRLALTSGLPTLIGLGYATWLWSRNLRQQRQINAPEIVQLMLLVLSGGWFAWFILLSPSWPRYACPPIFFSSPFIAALLHDLTDGFRFSSVAKTVSSFFTARLFSQQNLRTLCTLLLFARIGYSFIGPLRYLGSDTSVLQVAHLLNTATPPDSLVETYDAELFFLLDRPYHYPPPQIHVDLIRRPLLRHPVPIVYDPLAANPDYLVVGSLSRTWHLYEPLLATGAFRPLHDFGRYQIYQRNR